MRTDASNSRYIQKINAFLSKPPSQQDAYLKRLNEMVLENEEKFKNAGFLSRLKLNQQRAKIISDLELLSNAMEIST